MNEEKEAIERIQKRIKDNEDYSTNQVWLTEDLRCARVILNLIQKQENANSSTKINSNILDEFASIFSQTLRILQEEIEENKENLHNFETVDNLITKWNDLVDYYKEGE